MSFESVVLECAKNKTIVAEFDRLTGYNLSMRGGGLELKIDEVTGRQDEGIAAFVEFVKDMVWSPLTRKSW